jgi:hypothetical protein
VKVQVGKQARDTLSGRGFADSGWAMEEHVMSAGSGYLTSPLSFPLPDHVCKIEVALGVVAGRVTPSPRSDQPVASARPAGR